VKLNSLLRFAWFPAVAAGGLLAAVPARSQSQSGSQSQFETGSSGPGPVQPTPPDHGVGEAQPAIHNEGAEVGEAVPPDAAEQPDIEIGDGEVEGVSAWMPTLDAQAAFDLVERGGPVVVILLVLSLVATTVIIMKLVQFLWVGVGSSRRTERALQAWLNGHTQEAVDVARKGRAPASLALAHGMRGLANGVDEQIVREDVERVALEGLGGLKSNMRVLEATVQIAPLLGLFGTVIGMISAFQALQNAGSEADPAVLAGGIWVALMTTAVGLAVAIPVAFVNYWLEGRIERERETTEAALTSLFTRRATAPQPISERDRVRVVPAAE